jgi:uncharacterized protein
MFPGAKEIDPTLHGRAFLESLEALFGGEEFVKNGILYFLPEGLVAVPDVLVKKRGGSVFGRWHYEVVEIKSSRQIREEHIMQAAYYNYIIGIIQGYTPEIFSLVDGQKEREFFEYGDYERKVKEVVREIKEILRGKPVAPAKLGWPWESFSIKKLKESKSISLIPNLYNSHREILLHNGIETLEDFFSLNAIRVEGIGFDTLEKYRRFAKAILRGKHAFLDKPFLPEGRVEIFMDFEGVEGLRVGGRKISCDYLIGLLSRSGGKEEYTSFVSPEPEREGEMLLNFLKFIQRQEEYVIYHFGSYEKTRLASMFNRHGIDESLAGKVLESMVDILPVARKHVIFPVHSYSLKEIGKYLGFSWSEIGNAKDSIALYTDFLKGGDREALGKIIQYNKEDCLALKRLKDFLVWGT